MVKLRGPGLSASASGSLADALTFSSSKGRAYLKHKPTPAQPRSGNQISMRAMMQFLSQQWQNLTAGNQATWAIAYPDPLLSAYNAFIKHNLNRWRNHKPPSKEYPAAETGAAGDNPNLGAHNGVRHIDIAAGDDMGVAQLWGFLIFHSATATPDADFDKLVKIIRAEDLNAHWWNHSPLPTGTHYYRAITFTTSGKCNWSQALTDSGVVT